MKKIIAMMMVILTLSLVMAQAEEVVKVGLGKHVLTRDVTGKSEELVKLDAEAASRLNKKIWIMPRVTNCVTVGQAKYTGPGEASEETNWFQKTIEWITFWN